MLIVVVALGVKSSVHSHTCGFVVVFTCELLREKCTAHSQERNLRHQLTSPELVHYGVVYWRFCEVASLYFELHTM